MTEYRPDSPGFSFGKTQLPRLSLKSASHLQCAGL